MALPVNDRIDQFEAVGGEPNFVYTFPIQADTEIQVIQNVSGVISTLVLGVDYTVDGVGNESGGRVILDTGVFPAGAVAGDIFTNLGDQPITRAQSSDFVTDGDFFASTINRQLDDLTEMQQEARRDVDESIRKNPGLSKTLDPLLPDLKDRFAIVIREDAPDQFSLGLTSAPLDELVDDAEQSADEAAQSATEAATSADEAANSAAEASNSEGAAKLSEDNAKISEDNAKASETASEAAATAVAFPYLFDSSVVIADPGLGELRFDNANLALVTEIAISAQTNDDGNPDISDYIATWADSSNSDKGTITIQDAGDPLKFVIFQTNIVVDNGGFLTISVLTIDEGATVFSAAAPLRIQFTRAGDRGADTAITYFFEVNTADVDQGAGKLWLDNADFSLATIMFASDFDTFGNDIRDLIATLDDSTNTVKGNLRISASKNANKTANFDVVGTVTQVTGYSKIPITFQSEGDTAFEDDDVTGIAFSRSGDAGTAAGNTLHGTTIAKDFFDSPFVPSLAEDGFFFPFDTSAGPVVVNLSALSVYGQDIRFTFKKISGDTNSITINRGGTDTIDLGLDHVILNQGDSSQLVGDLATGGWNSLTNVAPAPPSSIRTVDVITSDGIQPTMTLSQDPGSQNNVDLAYDGAYQTPGVDFTLSGVTLTFVGIPVAGTNVTAAAGGTLDIGIGTPGDGTITFAKIAQGNFINPAPTFTLDVLDEVLVADVTDGDAEKKATIQQIIDLLPIIVVKAETGTTYTTILSDGNKFITLANAAAITLTIPTNASVAYPVGTTIAFQQIGAGLVTMEGAGVIFTSRNGLVSGGQFAVWSITKTLSDTWAVAGDLVT